MTVFCDIDGVLAEFCEPFSTLLHEAFGTPVVSTHEMTEWGLGRTKAQIEWGFERILEFPGFWENSPRLATPVQLRRIAAAHRELPIIFVTARADSAGDTVYHQTVRWLEQYGIMEPLVVVVARAGDKIKLIERFNPDFVIEDAPHTALAFAKRGVPVALMDWPYTASTRAPGIMRCGLTEALTIAGVP
jgi:uncharacterized HAD superfamily protein